MGQINDILRTKISDQVLTTPIYRDESNTLTWVPVCKIIFSNDLCTVIGLSLNGKWVTGSEKNVTCLTTEIEYMSLISCLKIHVNDLLEKISLGLKALELPDEIVNSFPVNEMIISGLNSNSEFWVDLALKRISEIDIDDTIKDALYKSMHKAPTQKLRHQAKKMYFQK